MGVEGDEAVRVGSISCAEQFLHLKGCRRRNEKDDLRCLLVGVASVLDFNGRDVEQLLALETASRVDSNNSLWLLSYSFSLSPTPSTADLEAASGGGPCFRRKPFDDSGVRTMTSTRT